MSEAFYRHLWCVVTAVDVSVVVAAWPLLSVGERATVFKVAEANWDERHNHWPAKTLPWLVAAFPDLPDHAGRFICAMSERALRGDG